MRRETFLIDTSAYVRLNRIPRAREEWREAMTLGHIGICWPTEVEIAFGARTHDEFARARAQHQRFFPWIEVPDDVGRRVLDLQEQLGPHGCHRAACLGDLMLCVTAATHGLTVLHYERDFETVAKVTGQPTRWIAPPGSLD